MLGEWFVLIGYWVYRVIESLAYSAFSMLPSSSVADCFVQFIAFLLSCGGGLSANFVIVAEQQQKVQYTDEEP